MLITELTDIKKEETLQFIINEGGSDLKENEWRVGPLHYDDGHDDVTAWGVFCLDPIQPELGDIYPIVSDIPYWDALVIARAHNLSHKIYVAPDPQMVNTGCLGCKDTFRRFELNNMQYCKACMGK